MQKQPLQALLICPLAQILKSKFLILFAWSKVGYLKSSSLHHGNPSLYMIWRINHHGEYDSLDPLKWDVQNVLGENISQGF